MLPWGPSWPPDCPPWTVDGVKNQRIPTFWLFSVDFVVLCFEPHSETSGFMTGLDQAALLEPVVNGGFPAGEPVDWGVGWGVRRFPPLDGAGLRGGEGACQM